MYLQNKGLCVIIPIVRSRGPPSSGNKETLAIDLQEDLPLAGFFASKYLTVRQDELECLVEMRVDY